MHRSNASPLVVSDRRSPSGSRVVSYYAASSSSSIHQPGLAASAFNGYDDRDLSPEPDFVAIEVKKARPSFQRTRLGCLACKKGKRKCSEQRPSCDRCTKSGYDCEYPEPTSVSSRPAKPPQTYAEELFKPYPTRHSSTSSRSRTSRDHQLTSEPHPHPPAHLRASTVSLSHPRTAAKPPSSTTASCPDASPYESRFSSRTSDSPASLLAVAYPDGLERELMLHYLNNSVYISGVPSGVVKFPGPTDADSLGLSLEDRVPWINVPKVLSTLRGQSTASDALAFAIMSVGAIHISHLEEEESSAQKLHAASNAIWDPSQDAGFEAHLRSQRYSKIAMNLRMASLALVRATFCSERAQGPHMGSVDGEEWDELFAACTFSTVTSILAGGGGFAESNELAHELITRTGGARVILERMALTGDRKLVWQVRTKMESFLKWQMMASFSHGRPPQLFSDDLDWLYTTEVPTGLHWDIAGNKLGHGRSLTELMIRVLRLSSSARSLAGLPESITVEASDLLYELNFARTGILTFGAGKELKREDMGTVIFTFSLEIIIMVDVMGLALTDPLLHGTAKNILAAVKECASTNGILLGLLWPVLIAGCCLRSVSEREETLRVLDMFRPICCFDLRTALNRLRDVWAHLDLGRLDVTWRGVASARDLLLV